MNEPDTHQAQVEAAAEQDRQARWRILACSLRVAPVTSSDIATPPTSTSHADREPDYLPSPEDLGKPGVTTDANGTDPAAITPITDPLIDNKDVEQDVRPVYAGKVTGKLAGAFWHRKEGTTALSIRFAWECTGDVKSYRYEHVNGRMNASAVQHPPGEVISEFRQIRDDGADHVTMSDAERISMETISKYYLSAVNQMYAGPGGAKLPDATVAKWQKELAAEGLRAGSKDKVVHRCVTDVIGRPVILVLEAVTGQSKAVGTDGLGVFKANGKPVYTDDPKAPKRQKIQVQAVAKAK